jgi:hypothetical protein
MTSASFGVTGTARVERFPRTRFFSPHGHDTCGQVHVGEQCPQQLAPACPGVRGANATIG